MLELIEELQYRLETAFAIIAAIMAIYNALTCFFGYKLFKIQLGIMGFIVGGLLGALLGAASANMVMMVICILILGVLGAWLAVIMYKLGVFLTVSSVTTILFMLLLSSTGIPAPAAIMISVIIGIVAGVLGVILNKAIIIIFTAISGGLMTGICIVMPFDTEKMPLGIVLGIIFAVLGVFVQYRLEKKDPNALSEADADTLPKGGFLLGSVMGERLITAAVMVVISFFAPVAISGISVTILIGVMIVLFSLRNGWKIGMICAAVCGFAAGLTGMSSALPVRMIAYAAFATAPIFYDMLKKVNFRLVLAALCSGMVHMVLHMLFIVPQVGFHPHFIKNDIITMVAVAAAVWLISFLLGLMGKDIFTEPMPLTKVALPKASLPVSRVNILEKKPAPPSGISGALVSNNGNWWCEGMPIMLTAMDIVKPNPDEENVALSISLQNLSREKVAAIYFDIKCFNILQQELEGMENVSLQDLGIEGGAYWTAEKPIILPDKDTRKCVLTCRNVVLTDETIWTNNRDLPLQKMPGAQPHELPKELAGEYFTQLAEKQGIKGARNVYGFVPDAEQGYWYCSCGQFNCLSDICVKCSIKKADILELYDPERLEEDRQARIAGKLQAQEERRQMVAEQVDALKQKGAEAQKWISSKLKS